MAPYQSLYRRYRPQRFGDLRGQEHVARALSNAVRDERVSHAYLFSGPRGTGKTSTARILAKALNCEAPKDGEPDGTCQSCLDIAAGTSLDVHELDAASNNGVDAMRDLVARAALGTPGRWKVYIVDEVHMLSTAASNALLKTLEEPPGHVVFVLATTDPQKVLPTIRSRTQHFEFRLLPLDVLVDHLKFVAADAGLDLRDEDIEAVARRGNGSARDALSALDQAAVGGEAAEPAATSATEIVEAMCEREVGRALVAVAEAVGAGFEPRQIARDVLGRLRQGFLSLMAPNVADVTADEQALVEDQARRLGPAAIVRSMEVLGEALIAMRDAPDTRVLLEVALVRLARPEADTSNAALLQRIERLERAQVEGPAAPPAPAPASRPPTAPATSVLPPPPPTPGRKRDAAAPPIPTPEPITPQDNADANGTPTRDDLTLAWGDHLLAKLSPPARALYKAGRFVDVEDGAALFALPNPVHRDRCERRRPEVETVLSDHFGRPVRMRLVVQGDDPAPVRVDEDIITPDDLVEGPPDGPGAAVASPIDHVMQAFQGAEVVEE